MVLQEVVLYESRLCNKVANKYALVMWFLHGGGLCTEVIFVQSLR